MKEVDVVNQ